MLLLGEREGYLETGDILNILKLVQIVDKTFDGNEDAVEPAAVTTLFSFRQIDPPHYTQTLDDDGYDELLYDDSVLNADLKDDLDDNLPKREPETVNNKPHFVVVTLRKFQIKIVPTQHVKLGRLYISQYQVSEGNFVTSQTNYRYINGICEESKFEFLFVSRLKLDQSTIAGRRKLSNQRKGNYCKYVCNTYDFTGPQLAIHYFFGTLFPFSIWGINNDFPSKPIVFQINVGFVWNLRAC